MELTDEETADLNQLLARVQGGKIANAEALDGFFAALVCCPDMILPSEYLPVIQGGASEEGDLVFEDIGEANRFIALVTRHYNHVNDQLRSGTGYFPLVLENDDGAWRGNDWANGFLVGTQMRYAIWSEVVNSEEHGGPMVPIFALAYENDPDPAMRPFAEPIDVEKREELLVSAAAGVMRLHRFFLDRRADHAPEVGSFVRQGRKIGRNEPCPCGSGRKFKQCCGRGRTLH